MDRIESLTGPGAGSGARGARGRGANCSSFHGFFWMCVLFRFLIFFGTHRQITAKGPGGTQTGAQPWGEGAAVLSEYLGFVGLPRSQCASRFEHLKLEPIMEGRACEGLVLKRESPSLGWWSPMGVVNRSCNWTGLAVLRRDGSRLIMATYRRNYITVGSLTNS